jgi:hypothetical protein
MKIGRDVWDTTSHLSCLTFFFTFSPCASHNISIYIWDVWSMKKGVLRKERRGSIEDVWVYPAGKGVSGLQGLLGVGVIGYYDGKEC